MTETSWKIVIVVYLKRMPLSISPKVLSSLCACLPILAAPAFSQTVGGTYDVLLKAKPNVARVEPVSIAGDVNGDGFDDLIIGAPGAGPHHSGAAYVHSGANGSRLFRDTGEYSHFFGQQVSGAGDMNGDGFDDVIVGIPMGELSGASANTGYANVYSGADGSILHQWRGERTGDSLGYSVSDAGDVNGDGFADVIVGVRNDDHAGMWRAGSAIVYSGLDGTVIYRWYGISDYRFGFSVSGAGDVNADGVPDLIVGSEGGTAKVYSGLTGDQIYQWGTGGYTNVSDAGDLNADGFGDVIVGSLNNLATVYSGADGSVLYEWSITDPFVSDAGDFNKDGFGDVVIGGNRTAYIYSGFDGALLFQFEGVKDGSRAVSGGGDVNNDGFDDVIVNIDSSAYVLGFNPCLTASQTQISVAAGGNVDLYLNFPESAAGYEYRILASYSGTGPTSLGVEIPLTLDALVRRCWFDDFPLSHKGRWTGNLNSQGQAASMIGFTAGHWTELVGTTFHIAAVAMAPGNLPEFSSVAVPLTIAP